MNANDLIAAYQQQNDARKKAKQDEADYVKKEMAIGLEESLNVWFGEFYGELESVGKPGEFDFRPDRNSDVNASLELFRSWRGILVSIYVTASKRKGDMYNNSRGLGARIEFSWTQSVLPGKVLYEKKFSVDLPTKDKERTSETWFFVDAAGAVDVAVFGKALVEALEIDKNRRAEIEKAQQEHFAWKMKGMEASIARARDDDELDENYSHALTTYPDMESRWVEAFQARQAELDNERIAREEFDAEVARAWGWIETEFLPVLTRNREKLARIQAALDGEFLCYQMEYGIVSQDDDGEVFAHTETMYVLERNVDEHGYYVRLSGKAWLVQVIHPVMFTAVTFSRLEDAPRVLTMRTAILDALDDIVCWVTDAEKAVAENERQGPFEKLPKLPEKPSWRVAAWQRAYSRLDDWRAKNALRDMDYDDDNNDIPF